MKKTLVTLTLLFMFLLANTCWGKIILDESGNKFITIGSTKDEVLEVLGTPSNIYPSLNEWGYNCEYISFDGNERIKGYTNAKTLKILMIPKSKSIVNESLPTPKATSSPKTILNTIQSTNESTSIRTTYIPASSCYGEISEKTGRPKTVAVKGYTRKDGTYVKPHYRSAPRRK